MKASSLVCCIAVLILVSSASPRPSEAEQRPASTVGSAAAVQSLVDQYCITCHNQRQRTAGLALEELNPENVREDAEAWELVVRKVRAGMMPPSGVQRPERATLQAFTNWLETELDRNAPRHFPSPGLHRLNRTEYANAIRDLLNLEIDPAKYLPSDDSSYGFDNMAGTLGLSSTLVEAYVSAAAKLSRLAMGEATTPTLTVYRAPEDTSQDYHVEGLPFGTRGGMQVNHVFPSDGEYTFTITPVFGDNMSPTGFGTITGEKLEVLLDGQRLELLNWQSGRGGQGLAIQQQTVMRVRIPVQAGTHQLGVAFLATNLAPVLDMDKHFMRTTIQTGPTPGYTFFPHVGTVRIEGPFNAVNTSASPSRSRIFLCTPASVSEETACARRILTDLATRAFRRPASAEDLRTLMEFYEQGRRERNFDYGIELALARILAAPQFVYRIEAEPANLAIGQSYRIGDLELASRLSYFLWSTGPDAELMDLASRNRLRDPAVLERQVRRMLADPKAEALARNFAGQWLNLRGLQSSSPLPLVYPDFDDPLRQAMRREVELLFDSVVREDRNVADLLNADYTFVNERLARHYGIPNIYGSHFRRITLDATHEARKGLTGKGAILVTSSKPDRTSPVTRGKWIMTNLLGVSPPDPPPDVPALPARTDDARGALREPSMRQKMLDHRVGAACVQCHNLMDPLGFALENFDGIGLWRTEDAGNSIEAAEKLYDGAEVAGPGGLREWLSTYSDQFIQVATEKLFTYGLGRGVTYEDMPQIRSIVRGARPANYRFSSLVLGIVKSNAFQMNMKVQQSSGSGSN